MAKIKGLQKPTNRRKAVRPPRLSSIPAVPRGPRAYQVPKSLQIGTTGPGEPPPGFVTATTSRVEWWVYWALYKVLAPNMDPRDGKNGFVGIPGVFSYQVAYEGGRNRLGGGAIIDFTVEPNTFSKGMPIAFRLQTERFHVFTSDIKQSYEQLYRSRLSTHYILRDLYESNFLFDQTGQAVVINVKRALAGYTEPNPARGGNPLRIPANLR